MGLTEKNLLDALRRVRYPGFTRDIVSLGVVKTVGIADGQARVALDLGPAPQASSAPLHQAVRDALLALEGVNEVEIVEGVPVSAPGLKMAAARPSVAAAGGVDAGLIPEVRQVLAVASGKGGVGKSTVAVNLAVALAQSGLRVGLLDADIYGPSIPLMMGLRQRPRLTADKQLVPFEKFGVRSMSLGLLVDPDSAVIWRGPMVMKALEQLLRDVQWGALDLLVVDMPPGTGDAQLTLSQRVRLAGAIIVTTPQDVALADAIKGVAMFRKVDVPVLGIVENMSYFECPHCSERTNVFTHGGGRRQAERLGVPFLGEVPLDPAICSGGDRGEPVVSADPASGQARVFLEIAARVRDSLGPPAEPLEPPTGAAGGIFDRFRKVWGAKP